MNVLDTCICGVSTSKYFQRASEAIPQQFRQNVIISNDLRLYLLCTQFVCDLRSFTWSHLYPSLYLWDQLNGVQHLEKQLWMELTKQMGDSVPASFINRMQTISSVPLGHVCNVGNRPHSILHKRVVQRERRLSVALLRALSEWDIEMLMIIRFLRRGAGRGDQRAPVCAGGCENALQPGVRSGEIHELRESAVDSASVEAAGGQLRDGGRSGGRVRR